MSTDNKPDIDALQRLYEERLAKRQAETRDELSVLDFDKHESPYQGHRGDQVEFSAMILGLALGACVAVGGLISLLWLVGSALAALGRWWHP